MKHTTFTGLSLALSLLAMKQLHAQSIQEPTVKSPTSFAIIVDQHTYDQAKPEIDAYRAAVEKDGLGTYIISSQWAKPDEIRTLLKSLYAKKQPLEGTVLIGDIPIPMLRDAQFLTSAFKMSQNIRWDKSSVPSDRYYDDFDLQFDFIKQDTAKSRSNYFYYSLSAASPQYIQMDIYSARIKPPVENGEDPIAKIKAYLKKVVQEKAQANPLNDMIASTGHGYNSNSVNATIGDALALRSQMPALFLPGNSVKFINFRSDNFIKFNILNELKREGLDFAYMTGHGTATLQLLNGYPLASNPQPSMENVARYLRSKLRSAKEDGRDVEAVKKSFMESLGVNEKWMLDAFDPKSIAADSLFNDDMDMQIHDIKDAHIKAPLVYLNSCLTGSFHLPNYLAGYYPFSDNDNIAAVANSVGVLQDLWPGELMGLLQHGVRVGNWMKHMAYLETHILGDPTFHFVGKADQRLKINTAIGSHDQNAGYWRTLLKENDADLQALALVYLSRILPEKEVSPLLKQYYFQSAFETVRTQAFIQLRQLENPDYFEVLHAAKSDSYEFIRRSAVYDLAEFGGNDFVKDMIQLYLSDPHSERVGYRLRTSLSFMEPALVKQEIDRQIRQNPNLSNAKLLADKLDQIVLSGEKTTQTLTKKILDKEEKEKERLNDIRTMRLYRYHRMVPVLIETVLDKSNSADIRVTALEALSWFPLSYQRRAIYDACEQVIKSDAPETVKYQSLKTKNIMEGYSKK
ncbi:HEAT repeat domain-containing protein [Sphingobacterium sp.]|uniref:HEAT repeat domain-containing protein n=1 Tax=Sphingobacterium sp. TaxID=341027 RepID=UPI0025869D31|nr:HEAT repeat domain-containing protein [Sphingobacterium sp.]WET68711.1 MAG: HEAT repeat domain-containing protein [Sphingobacterium sp.]